MPQPRCQQIDFSSTCYYHCMARCVRRAFLCGECSFSGKNYEHRKDWVVDRLSVLSKLFAIDIVAYAVMSNHYHLVLRVNPYKAKDWTDNSVIRRWGKLFSIPVVVKQAQKDGASETIKDVAKQLIEEWRSRLTDISWFMRCLNEHLARKANEEDECTGRFWEGRFKSQPLLDEGAILSAMAYVDLNPIRAKIANTPEASDYTSIKQRIEKKQSKPSNQSIKLLPLTNRSSTHKAHPQALSYPYNDYLELVDWTGRILREDKRGAIDSKLPPILERLNLKPDAYIQLMKQPERLDQLSVIGSPTSLQSRIKLTGAKFIRSMNTISQLYQT